MATEAGLISTKAKVTDLNHADNSKADLVIRGFDAADCGVAGMPAFDTSRDLVIDFTIASLTTMLSPNSPLTWLNPFSELRRKDAGKVVKHGHAAFDKHVTFWPAAATLDYGLGESAEILYKLIAAAAIRNTGVPQWRWHRTWRPRFAALRARQRYKSICHVLGMPPLCFPESNTVSCPTAVAATDALFAELDFDVFSTPSVAAAPSSQAAASRVTTAPRTVVAVASRTATSNPCTVAADALRVTASPSTARPQATASVHRPGTAVVDYFHTAFVPMPRATGVATPTFASTLLPLTSESSLPSEVPVVGSGEVVAAVLSNLPQ
jgi:hypothetical protein